MQTEVERETLCTEHRYWDREWELTIAAWLEVSKHNKIAHLVKLT